MEDFPIADSVAGTRKAQRFEGHVQNDLVAVLETVDQCARDTIDANRNFIDRMHLDTFGRKSRHGITASRHLRTLRKYRCETFTIASRVRRSTLV
jgi:hypothetical protein